MCSGCFLIQPQCLPFGLLTSAVVQTRSAIKQSALLLDAILTAPSLYLLYGNLSSVHCLLSVIMDVQPTTNTRNWNSIWTWKQSRNRNVSRKQIRFFNMKHFKVCWCHLVQYLAPTNNNVAQASFTFSAAGIHIQSDQTCETIFFLLRQLLQVSLMSICSEGPRYTDMLDCQRCSLQLHWEPGNVPFHINSILMCM